MIKGLEALRRIDKHLPRHEETQEKEFSEYVSIIEKELKALEIISKAYGDYANHKISEYELIMIVGENTAV